MKIMMLAIFAFFLGASFSVKANNFETGGNTYQTLAQAVNAVAEGGTITMLRDVTVSNSNDITLVAAETYTIDLNGYTLGRSGTFSMYMNYGTVTVKNGIITTKIDVYGGEVIIESGTYSGDPEAISCLIGKVTIVSGTFTSNAGASCLHDLFQGQILLADGSTASPSTGWKNSGATSVTVTAPATSAPTIITASLPDGTAGTAYSQTLTASGFGTMTWSVTVGSLPASLTLNPSTGVILGTPTTAGTFNFTVTATNSLGNNSKALSITIGKAAQAAPAAPTFASKTETSVTLDPITGAEYSCDNGINWQDDPAFTGLTANTAYTFIARMKETATLAASANSGTLTVTTDATPVAPGISTTSLPGGTVGTAYNETLTATGDGTITWSVTIGSLPAGLSLDGTTGVISGAPTTAGTFDFTVQATNPGGNDTQALSITVQTDITADFADASFLAKVRTLLGKGATDPIYDVDVATITTLNVWNSSITSLAGIEHFIALEELYCSYNQLSELPALPTNLEVLYCSINQLSELPALPTSLQVLDCYSNQLSELPALPSNLLSLDCSNNQLNELPALPSNLQLLACSDNPLSELPALPSNLLSLLCSNNPLGELPALPASLLSLACSNNQLSELPALPTSLLSLYCSDNQLSELPALPSILEELDCSNNRLTALDLTGMNSLADFDGSGQSSSLTLSGSGSSYTVAVSMNDGTSFGNSALSYSSGTLTSTDNTVTSSTFTGPTGMPNPLEGTLTLTYSNPATDITDDFTDPAFLAAVRSELGKGATDRIYDTDVAAITLLSVSYKGISSLAGVEHFVALQELFCNDNQLTELDVSGLNDLYSLYCNFNQLTELNVSGLNDLYYLNCSYNQLTALDVSGLTALEDLNCSYNQLTALNVSGLTALKGLNCYNNQLTELNVSGLNDLSYLNCNNNLLYSLDLTGLNSLADFDGSGQSSSLTLSGSGSSYTLAVSMNDGTSFGNSALSYSSGTLTSTDNTATSSTFTGPTGMPNPLEGMLTLTYSTAPSITTSLLPNGTVGAAYNETLAATGTTPITWSMDGGTTLPDGLTLDASTGEISGTPTAAGTTNFTVKASNSAGNDSKALSIEIAKASQTAPAAPTLASKTATSITLNTIAGAEYNIDSGAWQDSEVFNGLTPNTSYTFIARMKETATHAASPNSATLTVTSDKATLGGTVTVSGTTSFGETLTAVTSALNSTPTIADLGTLSYQWKRGGTDISGATNATYTTLAADLGQTLTVTVSAANCDGEVTSSATAAIAKAAQTAPSAPTLSAKTATSITLNTIAGAEYNIDSGAWQDSEVFNGLTPNTDYVFTARLKETTTHAASAASAALSVTSDKATLTGTITISGTATFGSTLTAVTSALNSTPTIADLGTLSYQWKRGGTDISSATGASYTTVVADIGQTLTVTVSAANCYGEVTSAPTASIAKVSQTAPTLTLASKTATSITLNTITGAEYNIDSGAWQDSEVFNGLTPNTAYTFTARLKETATHAASPNSAALSVTTNIAVELDRDSTLYGVTVNGRTLIVSDEMSYSMSCGEDDATLEIHVSSKARIFLNGVERDRIGLVPIMGVTTDVKIVIVAESGASSKEYSLTLITSLSDARLYFQRWDNVLAVNHNTATNGGYLITGVRWYKNDELVSNEQFVRYDGGGEYRAEVEVNGVWRRLCLFVSTRATSVVAHPNPVSRGESLTLQLPESFVGGKLSIYSIAGTLVKSGITLPTELSNVRIDDLPAGIYLFRVNSTNGTGETVKVVVSD